MPHLLFFLIIVFTTACDTAWLESTDNTSVGEVSPGPGDVSKLPELPVSPPQVTEGQCVKKSDFGPTPTFQLRRLTNRELDNVVSDLAGRRVSISEIHAFSPDGASFSFSQLPQNLSLPDGDLYSAAADTFSEAIMTSSWMAICNNASDQYNGCTKNIGRQFISRAQRQLISNKVVDEILDQINASLSDSTIPNAQGHSETLKAFFKYVFLSPEFLFHYESTGGNLRKDWFLASRLSFFFLGSIPDVELWADVNSGQVHRNFSKHLERLLVDKRALDHLSKEFAGQWLGSLNGSNVQDLGLMDFLNKELSLVIREFIERDIAIKDLLNPGFTYMNADLAAHYGMRGDFNSNWTRLRAKSRGGVLALGAFLAKSQPRPTPRGQLVMTELLCRPLGPPTGIDISTLKQMPTLRETLGQLWVNPSCKSCHVVADPVGFGIEKYDQTGIEVSTNVNGDPVDTSGWIGENTFETTEELAALLQEHPAFPLCVTQKLYSFANARAVENADKCRIQSIFERAALGQLTFKKLIREILLEQEFQGGQ